MPFELSFSESFFFGDGEPYDRGPYSEQEKERPHSVWCALSVMPEHEWIEMCESVFPGQDPQYVTIEDVLLQVESVDTCTDLRSPVEVWIDPEGWHRIRVWDPQDR